jgi:hypothetical protein
MNEHDGFAAPSTQCEVGNDTEENMRLTSPGTAIAFAVMLASTPAHLAAQDDWTRIKPGETPEGLVQKVLGPASTQQETFDGPVSVWKSKLAANEIRLRFSDDSLVREMVVVPAGPMTETQITTLFGATKERLHVNGDGSWVVAYPIGKAVVDYSRTGAVTKITVGPDAIRRAHSEAHTTKATVGVNSLFGPKKKKP